jgi:phage recombination protein Bet
MEKPVTETKKISLRDRKKAQPGAKIYFSEEEKTAIKETVAKNLDIPQTKIFFYQCQALGLNPLINEIAAITYKTKNQDGTYSSKMSIQVMRDGFLTIAHRSGKFAGIESGVRVDDKGQLVGWAKVYHKDFDQPVSQEADFNEYAMDRNPLWKSKPKTMIKKVAESMALRKAFNANGVYAPEEMELEIAKEKLPDKPNAIENGDSKATDAQIQTIISLDKTQKEESLKTFTRQEAADLIRDLSQRKPEKKEESNGKTNTA